MKIVYSYVPSVTLHTETMLQRFGDFKVKQRALIRAYKRSRVNSPPRIFPNEPLGLYWGWECDECNSAVRHVRVLPGCFMKVNCRKCKRTTEHVGVI